MPIVRETEIIQALDEIQKVVCNKGPSETLFEHLNVLKGEFNKTGKKRFFAAEKRGVPVLTKILHEFFHDKMTVRSTFDTLTSLIKDQPHILTHEGVEMITKYLDEEEDPLTIASLLQWMAACCSGCERNRQNMLDARVPKRLGKILDRSKDPTVIKNVCKVIRALILDDDITCKVKSPFARADFVGQDVIVKLVELLEPFGKDTSVLDELLKAVSRLTVNDKMCGMFVDVENGAGVKYIINLLRSLPNDEPTKRKCLRALKLLSRSDKAKEFIVKCGGGDAVIALCNTSLPLLTVDAFSCLAALALRHRENGQTLCDAGIVPAVVTGMGMHVNESLVQKYGCWVIRNIVGRNKELRPLFLDLDVADILKQIQKNHPLYHMEALNTLRMLGIDEEETFVL